MIRARWRMRTLMALVLLAALGVKGVLFVLEGRRRQELRAQLSIFNNRLTLPEPVLLAALDDADPGVRGPAVWALDTIGSTSPALVRALIARLEVETEKMQWQNRRDPHQVYPAMSLRRIKPPASLVAPLLRKAMASPEPSIRLSATAVLCDVAACPGPTDPTMAELLLKALQDPEAAIRALAPEALARLDANTRRQAVAIMLNQLRRPDRQSQLLAAIGLARFGSEAEPAVAILADRLRTNVAVAPPEPPPAGPGAPAVAIRTFVMGRPGEEVGGVLGARLLDVYLLGRLGSVARPAVPEVVLAMTSRDAEEHVPFFNQACLPRQGTWHWIEVQQLLENGAGPTPFNLRDLGAAVLGRIGPEAERQAVDLLVGMMRGEDGPRALGAVQALGAMGPKASGAFPALLARAEQDKPGGDDWRAMFFLTSALAQLSEDDEPRLVAALLRLMDSKDPTKRNAAVTTLSHLEPPPPAAVPAMIAALKDETQGTRFHAAIALGRYEGPDRAAAVPALIDALEDQDVGVRRNAAISLAHYRAGAGRVVPMAIHLLQSEQPSVRSHAAELLGAYGPEAGAAVPALREARRDKVSNVRDAAEEALKAVAPSEAAGPIE